MEKEYSAEWYEKILNSISELLLVKGDKSKLIWANKAFCDYYGMTKDELKNLIDSPNSDPDDTIQYIKDDHYVFTKGIRLDIPSEAVTDHNGTIAYFHTIKSPVFDSNGKVYQTVGVARMVEDKQLINESEIARNENKSTISDFKTLIKNSPLAVLMLDKQNRILNSSQLWLDIFHPLSKKNILGQDFEELFESELKLIDSIELAKCGELQKLIAFAYKDLFLDIQIRPWAFANQEIGGTLIVAHDISDLKKKENRLQQLNDELNQFNYRVSHDLVSPLKTVEGLIDIADQELSDGNVDFVKNIHKDISKSIKHLSGLIEDVVNLSRTDIEHQQSDKINFSKLFNKILDKYSVSLKEINMHADLDVQITEFISSKTRIEQIFDNLISNAIKYYNEAEPNPFIHIKVLDNNDKVKVLVEDNGIGLEKDTVEKVFDIFTRANSKTIGSGLGLYIVKKHLNILNGNIQIINLKNNTIFEVTIPKVFNEQN